MTEKTVVKRFAISGIRQGIIRPYRKRIDVLYGNGKLDCIDATDHTSDAELDVPGSWEIFP